MKVFTNLLAGSSMLCFLLLITTSCEININTDGCLKCEYQFDGIKVTKELCDDLGTDDEKDTMRDMMQSEADSLGVVLTCETQ